MRPEQIYKELKELAEKLDVKVVEKSFRNTGIKVKSGLCKVKDQNLFIMDKNISLYGKTEILIECLSQMPHEEIYVVPELRELLDKNIK